MGLILLIVSFWSMQMHTKSEHIPFIYQTVPILKDLRLQAITSKCRLVIIPSIIAVTLCCNQKKILEMMQARPVTFALLAYFLGNCVIDSIAKYRQIDQTLDYFVFAQTMNRYMLCVFAVKNTMKKLSMTKTGLFNEQDFLTKVMQNTGYSMHELEIFSEELLQSSIYAINRLCMDINTTDLEGKFYTVLKEEVTLEQMLLFCKNDNVVYVELMKFHENPEQKFDEVMTSLCVLIRKHFNFFMKIDDIF